MISFSTESGRFNYRSGAVIIHENHVLLHKDVEDEFWALPGGRVEFHEYSNKTVCREISEELGWQSEVIKHLWYLENFFEYRSELYHEISNIFLVSLINHPSIDSEADFIGIEEPKKLVFRWVPLALVSEYKIQPNFLQDRLNSLPDSLEHIQVGASDV